MGVQLLKDEKQLTVDGVKVTQSGQIFTIHKFSRKDKGTYQCQTQESPPLKSPRSEMVYDISKFK